MAMATAFQFRLARINNSLAFYLTSQSSRPCCSFLLWSHARQIDGQVVWWTEHTQGPHKYLRLKAVNILNSAFPAMGSTHTGISMVGHRIARIKFGITIAAFARSGPIGVEIGFRIRIGIAIGNLHAYAAQRTPFIQLPELCSCPILSSWTLGGHCGRYTFSAHCAFIYYFFFFYCWNNHILYYICGSGQPLKPGWMRHRRENVVHINYTHTHTNAQTHLHK